MDQLLRWAVIAADDAKVRYGAAMRVMPVKNAEGAGWGFLLDVLRDGEPTATLGVGFDLEQASKHQWVGRGEDGFPILEGTVTEVEGKNFEIRCDTRAGSGVWGRAGRMRWLCLWLARPAPPARPRPAPPGHPPPPPPPTFPPKIPSPHFNPVLPSPPSFCRKVCDRTIDEDTRTAIRNFCTTLEQAVNKYYAFGSCFVDDST